MNTKKYLDIAGVATIAILAILLFRECNGGKGELSALQTELTELQASHDTLSDSLKIRIGENSFLFEDNKNLREELKIAHNNVRTIVREKVIEVEKRVLYSPNDQMSKEEENKINANAEKRVSVYRDQVKSKDNTIDELLAENAKLKNQAALNNLTNQFSKDYNLPELNKVAKLSFLYNGMLVNEPSFTLSDLRQRVEEPVKEKPFYRLFITAGISSLVNNENALADGLVLYDLGFGASMSRRLSFGIHVNSDDKFENLGGGIRLGYHFNLR